MGKTDSNGKQTETTMVLDLSDFVTEVDRFSRLIEPFALVFYFIDDIRRWRFCKSTIAVWLMCNIACIWLSQGAVFVLVSALVIGIATLSLFQVHTKILNKILPNNKKTTKISDEEEVDGPLHVVQNFRYSLIEMHDFVVKSNEYLNYFYSILRWDAVLPSAIYHIEVCVFLLSIVICPARWNCFLVVNWFFLCHPHILRRSYTYFKDKWLNVQQKPNSNIEATNEQDKQKLETLDDVDGGENELSADDSSDQDLTDEVSDTSLIQLDPSPSKPGMVARLMEIKKRRKQTASGLGEPTYNKQGFGKLNAQRHQGTNLLSSHRETCLGCKVSFASILKKRLYCRHCGYSFCNRCCYQKVPRSVLGATSPAALKETVLVCCSCHALLTSQADVNVEAQAKLGPG